MAVAMLCCSAASRSASRSSDLACRNATAFGVMKGIAGGFTQNDDGGGTEIMDLLQGSVDPMQYALLEPERLTMQYAVQLS